MDQVQPTGRIDVISDVICPRCYIGKRQLERALDLLAAHHCRVRGRLAPVPAQPRDAHRGRRAHQLPHLQVRQPERSRQLDQRITETAATVGLEFHLDRIVRTPNTVNAHRLIRFAGQRACRTRSSRNCSTAILQGRRHRAIRRSWRTSRPKPDSTGPKCSRCWLATRAGAKCWPPTRWRATRVSRACPASPCRAMCCFSGAVPAEEMAETFRRAWEILKERAAVAPLARKELLLAAHAHRRRRDRPGHRHHIVGRTVRAGADRDRRLGGRRAQVRAAVDARPSRSGP